MAKRIMNSGFENWKPNQLPDLTDKTFVITGANSGIGYEAAKYLGEVGANIVMACRSMDKAEKAKSKLLKFVKGDVDIIQVNLSDLASVRKAAAEVRSKYDKIDGLVNNAGIMQTPKVTTIDGFDLQMASNHLGHFLWTGLLIDLVEAASGRIAIVSSLAHKLDKMHFDDFMSEQSYDPMKAYIQSKLSNIMFAFMLDRKLKRSGSNVACISCHPGWSATNLQSTGPKGFFKFLYKPMNFIFAQDQKYGAIPTVLAAAGNKAKRGGYYGPQSMFECRGRVSDATVSEHALNENSQEKLWSMSEELVDFQWKL